MLCCWCKKYHVIPKKKLCSVCHQKWKAGYHGGTYSLRDSRGRKKRYNLLCSCVENGKKIKELLDASPTQLLRHIRYPIYPAAVNVWQYLHLYDLWLTAEKATEIYETQFSQLEEDRWKFQHALFCRVVDPWNIRKPLVARCYYHRQEKMANRPEDVELPSGFPRCPYSIE